MARTRKIPIPVTIVAGQRGAGKTTLINRLLVMPAFADTAVLLNDFGEVPLAGGLVETASDGYLAFSSGCICCAVRGALADGLEKLLRDLDNGRIAKIGRVIIEADAAADPAAILAQIVRHPYLALRFHADGIVTVLDASAAEALLARSAEAVTQAAMADVVALTRVPSAPAAALVASLNPLARVVEAEKAAAVAFSGYGAFDPEAGDLAAWLGTMPDGEGTTAPVAGEGSRIRAFALRRERAIPLAELDRFLDYLTVLQGPRLLRVRGAVASGEGGAVLADGIGGLFHPPLMTDIAFTGTHFAVIARDLAPAMFAGYLDAFLNEARIDTPDRAALVDNPLAIAGFSARPGNRR